MTTRTVKLWSEAEKAIVTWSVGPEKETDEGGNEHEFIAVRYGDEVHRFSPNYTDDELQRVIAEMNEAH